jgi:hypothetical protein
MCISCFLQAIERPPKALELSLGAIMTLTDRPASWEEAVKHLAAPSFVETLLDYDREKIDENRLRKILKYTRDPAFSVSL